MAKIPLCNNAEIAADKKICNVAIVKLREIAKKGNLCSVRDAAKEAIRCLQNGMQG